MPTENEQRETQEEEGRTVNKAPAFLFYANDWLSSPQISLMTPAQEGAYIRLLAYAWASDDCSLPDDDEQLSILSRLGEGWFKGGSTAIRKCFILRGSKLYNEKLVGVRQKQEEWRKKSRDGGLRSAKSRKKNSLKQSKGGCQMVDRVVGRVVQPKGNISISNSTSTNVDVPMVVGGDIDPLEGFPVLAEAFPRIVAFVAVRWPKTCPTPSDANWTKWRTELASLVRLDGYNEREVVDCLTWLWTGYAPDPEFDWREQIQTLNNIRTHKSGKPSKFERIYRRWQIRNNPSALPASVISVNSKERF